MKLPRLLAITFLVLSTSLFSPAARAEDTAPAVTTIVTNGGDDLSYKIPITVSVVYDGVTYTDIYATTNSVITFGAPDGTYWAYPQTPSISVESRDWWALPYLMADTHFIINVSSGGFQVDGAYRPYGSYSGDVTNIVITAQVQTDGTVAYSYATSGPLWGDERTGARLNDGTVVTLEQAGVTQVVAPPVLEPEPVVPTPEVSPSPEPTPAPQPAPQPEPQPIPAPPAPEPPLVVVPEPVAEPPVPVEPPPVEEVPAPQVPEPAPELPSEPPVVKADEIDLESLPPETPVELANGVVVTAEVAMAVQLLQNPGEMLATIFTNPIAALAALGNVGADLPPEVRVKAEKVVVSAIIAGNIATQAAAGAAATAAYRRKP